MNERAILEARHDVMSPTVAALRSETQEAFRLRKMAMLREDIAHYSGRLNILKAANPGERVGERRNVTAEWLADEAKFCECRITDCHDELIEFAMSEVHAAADRAESWPLTFLPAAE